MNKKERDDKNNELKVKGKSNKGGTEIESNIKKSTKRKGI